MVRAEALIRDKRRSLCGRSSRRSARCWAAATAALENFRARCNRVFDVGSDGLYRKGLRFKQHHASVA
jgi:hypothetical protein